MTEEQKRQKRARWHAEHREEEKERKRQWHAINRATNRERVNAYQRELRAKRKATRTAKYSFTCQNCGSSSTSEKPTARFCSKSCARSFAGKRRHEVVLIHDQMVREAEQELNGVAAQLPLMDGAIITVEMVKREEGITDYKRTPHVCRFYPPAMRCTCGKQGQQPAPVYRRVTFQPMAAGD